MRKEHRRWRLLLVLVGAITMMMAAMILGAYSSLERLQVAGEQVFPPPLDVNEAFDSAASATNARRRVKVTVTDRVQVELRLQLPDGDELIDAVAAGRFSDTAERFADTFIAQVQLEAEEYLVPLQWRAPTVDRDGDGTDTVTVSGVSPDSTTPNLAIRVRAPSRLNGCLVDVQVTSEGRHIVRAVPQPDVRYQYESSLEASACAGTEFVVDLQEPGASQPPFHVLALPVDVMHWLTTVALAAWPLKPWLYLRKRMLTTNNLSGESKTARHVREISAEDLHLLLALGTLAVVAVTATYFNQLVGRAQSVLRDAMPLVSPTEPLWPLLFGSVSTVPAVVAALTVWAWQARARARGGRAAVSGLLLLVAVILGIASIAASLVALDEGGPRETAIIVQRAHAVGCAMALVGSYLLARAVRSPRCSSLAAALVGTGVLSVLSLVGEVYSREAAWLAGIITAVCDAALIAALVWVTAVVTRHPLPRRWRRKTWLRLAVPLLAMLAVVPATYWPGSLAALSDFDAVSLSYSLQTLVRTSLLVAGISLLWSLSRARSPLHRDVAVAVAVALLLRPDVLYAGVPWSLLVGWLLVAVVLLPRTAASARELLPTGKQNSQAVIREALDASAKSRTSQDMEASLRNKISHADLPADDAATIRRTVTEAFGGRVGPPDRNQRLDALAWAGQRDPWRRGVVGALAAGTVGLVLQLGTLARTLSDISTVVGPDLWQTIAATVLAFQYPVYGLVFGFLYPLIPSVTGLAKGARLFVVLTGSEIVVLLVPLEPGADLSAAITLLVLQLAVVCGVLGVGGDVLALRQVGSGMAGLRDIYHTNRLVLWSSGLAVATATAVATAMLGSAASLLVERVLPPGSPPPASRDVGNTPSSGS